MKIAVCVSGAIRSGINRDFNLNVDRLSDVFPTADFYFATWPEYQDIMPAGCHVFDPPEMFYHPFIDVTINNPTPKIQKMVRQAQKQEVFREQSKHQTKQILIHSYLMDVIPHYDIIIRSRFDTCVYKNASFDQYIDQAYRNNQAIGFATLHPSSDAFTQTYEQKNNDYHNNFLFDQLIIHPKDLLDTEMVYNMHRRAELAAAEHGWWQALSKNNNHRCIAGWANPDKSVNAKFL